MNNNLYFMFYKKINFNYIKYKLFSFFKIKTFFKIY